MSLGEDINVVLIEVILLLIQKAPSGEKGQDVSVN
jgi:hypothetical protein